MERNLRKERIGIVVSNKMDKSIVVAVKRKVNILFMASLLTEQRN
jgi:ribosomal protein S17